MFIRAICDFLSCQTEQKHQRMMVLLPAGTHSNHAGKKKKDSFYLQNHRLPGAAPPKLPNAFRVVRQVSQSGKPHLHRNQPQGCFLNLQGSVAPFEPTRKSFTLSTLEPATSLRTDQTSTGCPVSPSVCYRRNFAAIISVLTEIVSGSEITFTNRILSVKEVSL